MILLNVSIFGEECYRVFFGVFVGDSCREEVWNLGSIVVLGGRWGIEVKVVYFFFLLGLCDYYY